MDFGTIIYILIAIGFFLYQKAKKDAAKKPANAQGESPRKDGDFSLEDVLRKIKEAQQTQTRTTYTPPPTTTVTDDRLPFEKRQPLERTSKNREKVREMIDYDERAIARLQNPPPPKPKHKVPSSIDFHFSETEKQPEIREWLDLRKAIIGAEILRRPEY